MIDNRTEVAVEKADRDIQRILLTLAEDFFVEIDAVEVDVRRFANCRTEITVR